MRIADSANYLGLQISNSLVSYLLVLGITLIVTIIFTWPSIILTVLSFWRLILALAIPPIINVVVKKVALPRRPCRATPAP